ncbi:PadR family transcriptional regulator [Johnsonella ignava]|uniref:PadR family transcriptional regulator n=1 Tax=Johnsonella ignava TaxID=43995 RepID=UPI0023F2EA11|nr:PadR family transcriptional regulator [Johnsonella ignava]
MDKIILGILMLHRMTAYEIKNVIKNSFKSMCSDSLGSIQVALKRLFEMEMVIFEEVVENGVNKKRYAITEVGQAELLEWLKIPIDNSKTKNVDLAKLLFMGYVSKKEQEILIDKVILSLEEEYRSFLQLRESIDISAEQLQIEEYLNLDKQYQERMKSLYNENNLSNKIKEISKFTLAALDYGIDNVEFNIEWFKKLKKKL